MLIKNKLFQVVLAVLIVVTLILATFFILWNFMEKNGTSDGQSKAPVVQEQSPNAVQIKELTVIVKDIMTNLADQRSVIRATFAFQMSHKAAKDEFETLDFKMKGIINLTLADLTAEQINGSQGHQQLAEILKEKINAELKEGSVVNISIPEIVMQ